MRRFLLLLGLATSAAAVPPPPPQIAPSVYPLVWDATKKRHDAKPGETSAAFVFSVTNTSADEIEITRVQPACACTVAPMPRRPWVLGPGESDTLTATMNFEDKHGVVVKTLLVESTRGSQTLTVTVNIPDLMDEGLRRQYQDVASRDRQAVWHNECAACHLAPTVGKKGAKLFAAACGICHASDRRASMVPDLQIAHEARDAAYWRKWIETGKEGTLMPAFATERGGPLSAEQIESLVRYAMEQLPREPARGGTGATPAP